MSSDERKDLCVCVSQQVGMILRAVGEIAMDMDRAHQSDEPLAEMHRRSAELLTSALHLHTAVGRMIDRAQEGDRADVRG